MTEELRDIEGFENYKVSNMGYVFSMKSNRILKVHTGRKGHYYQLNLCKEGKVSHFVLHNLVARHFPEICGQWFPYAEVDHIDGNSLNNRADNLRWVTKEENTYNPTTFSRLLKRAEEMGKQYGAINQKYGAEKVRKPIICLTAKEYFPSQLAASKATGIDNAVISRICYGKQKQAKNGYKFAFYDCTDEPK